MAQEKIILKDILFNRKKVSILSSAIKNIYTEFDEENYLNETVKKFPELELKQRIFHMKDMLKEYLPDDYEIAVNIMLKSLPADLDNTKTDDDFGLFIWAPYGEFIAEFGCCDKYLEFSLKSMEKITRVSSMEFAIRPFLKQYPTETLKFIRKCSKSDNYHVRRFASEGIRPNLPWGGKVDLGIGKTISILDNLYTDHTQYVLRSVANNLNDITKLDTDAVIQTLLLWKKSGKQTEKNILFLIKHALRTQIKAGNPKALELLGFYTPDIKIENFKVSTKKVMLGESLGFSFQLQSNISQKLLINYVLHFVNPRGRINTKIFNITKKNIIKNENIKINKKHTLRSMTTKKLYTGTHFVEIFINGKIFEKQSFELEVGEDK